MRQTLVLVKSKYSGGELRFKVATDQGRLKAYKRYMDGYCVSRKFSVTPFTSEQYVRGQTLVLVKSKYSGGELKFKVTTDQSKLQGYTKYVDGFCLEWKYCDETDDEKV
ncbi:hypothetical protein IWQ56_003738 [Coemansia nantahalensis]|nr:hypothetical protein IWQ56_003738 [Coemansia nantahalensis]